jgi:ubiquinone/menaquinone biosynthesis C-methylase UbiE
MPEPGNRTHNRANMYGLAHHAGHYERWASVLARPLYRRVVNDVAAAGLFPGAAVLDVGTGPGTLPLQIAARSPHLLVAGVDLSPEMIARASAAAEAQAAPDAHRISFHVADVAHLPFEDQSFDLVVSTISLHHWADLDAGVQEVARVLRPGARAWLYDVRPTTRGAARTPLDPEVDVRLENPLAGTWRVNPIGRLVLRRDS